MSDKNCSDNGVFDKEISHGIKTAANSINGFVKIALSKLSSPEVVGDCLNKINYSTYTLLSLLNSLHIIDEINSGNITVEENEISLGDGLHAIINELFIFVRSRNIKLKFRVSDIKSHVYFSDKTKLRQVISNLIKNAIIYSAEGGEIVVTVKQTAESNGTGTYEMVIADNGVGANAKKLSNIFEYDPTDEENLRTGGLDLWIAKKYMDVLGGKLEISSRENFGTTATLSLHCPIKQSEPINKEFAGLMMLIVADDVAEGRCIADAMSAYGVKSIVTRTSQEALETVSRVMSQNSGFDVALIDSDVSGGGSQLIADIRRRAGARITTMLFGYEQARLEAKAKSIGAKAVVARPVISTELAEILRTKSNLVSAETSNLSIDLKGMRVLIVEDNSLNLEMTKAVITELTGATVETANNGRDAFNMVRKNGYGYYTLIFMDIYMPLMSGYETTQLIRGLNNYYVANLPIIAMTASDSEQDKQDALDSGMNDLIPKPIDTKKILSVIKTYVQL